jgi:hypothetical protein
VTVTLMLGLGMCEARSEPGICILGFVPCQYPYGVCVGCESGKSDE